jgi:predicted nucleic acid-binding Zn ribbon protein
MASFVLLHDVIAKALGNVAQKTTSAAALQPVWREAVGANNAEHSWPVSLAHGVLTVRADHPARAQAIEVLQAQVLKRLKELLGEGQVTKLSVFVG